MRRWAKVHTNEDRRVPLRIASNVMLKAKWLYSIKVN